MKETRLTSTNGRWGLTVVHPDDINPYAPVEGTLESLGEMEGHKTFVLTPQEGTGRWYVLAGDAEPIAVCEVVARVGLQSGRGATLLVLGSFAAYRQYGYRRRSERIVAWREGREIDLPPSVMAAMGLLPAERQKVEIEPPALDNALAAALKEAGL